MKDLGCVLSSTKGQISEQLDKNGIERNQSFGLSEQNCKGQNSCFIFIPSFLSLCRSLSYGNPTLYILQLYQMIPIVEEYALGVGILKPIRVDNWNGVQVRPYKTVDEE